MQIIESKNRFFTAKPLITFVIVGMTLTLSACGTNPVTGSREIQFVSQAEEENIGKTQYQPAQQSQGGELKEYAELSSYVRKVGLKLAKFSHRPELPYDFVILDNPVPNAWALPGGKVAINWGLLLEMKDEAELAAVLGHEITHATARHGAKSMERSLILQAGMSSLMVGLGHTDLDQGTKIAILSTAATGGQMINSKYGRGAELESDKFGIGYMVKASYDPRAAIQLQETFVRISKGKTSNFIEGLFASHPPSQERVEQNIKTANLYLNSPPVGGWIVKKEEYQSYIAPLYDLLNSTKKIKEANRALKEGRLSDALDLIESAEFISPNYALVHGLKAAIQRKSGKMGAAKRSINHAISLRNNFYQFYEIRGLLSRDEGFNEQAIADLKKAYTLLPTTFNTKMLSQLHLSNGNNETAQFYLNKLSQ